MSRIRFISWMVMTVMISNLYLYPARLAFAQTANAGQSAVAMKPVSINKADSEELQSVRGIGPAMAERILEYRKANGGFKSLDQLKEVKGIGDLKFEKIKDQITL
ncbi:MAG: helix-hairpin-helix domain-containing protein [Candidatus Omnitrophica bacterium]|nr:helix-hairpin-helix domain-containing protein [Candidatus Omnitrophota bacterium]